MPEGDTVWLAARRLHEALAGRSLTVTDFRVPQLATTDLTGRPVQEVVSRGKHLLFRIGGGVTLHTHFRMDGSWHLYAPGQRWRGGPDWQVRAVLATSDAVAVGYRLPVVELIPTAAERDTVGHLGPDLLDEEPDLDEAVQRLRAEPGREIGLALLDQRNLAGLGNLYRCEALFLTGVSPWLTVSQVSDLAALVGKGRVLLRANRWRPEQSTTGSLRPSEQHWVFERTGRGCRRCGTAITSAEQGSAPHLRLTYWCPRCQPGPGPRQPRETRWGGGTRYRP